MKITYLTVAFVTMLNLGSQAQEKKAIDTLAIVKPLNGFIEAFNQRKAKLPDGLFTQDAFIVDLFAPFTWTGKIAMDDWYSILYGRTPEEQTRQAASKQHVEISKLSFLDVKNDVAYFSVPADLTYTNVKKGTRHVIKGYWTVTVKQVSGNWLMTSNVWAVVSLGVVKS